MNSPTGYAQGSNPLADFNDALNRIGPAQAEIAADTMHRWLATRRHETPLPGGGVELHYPPKPIPALCPHGVPSATPGGVAVQTCDDCHPKQKPDAVATAPVDGVGETGGAGCVAGSPCAPLTAPGPTGSAPSLAAFSQTLRPYQEAVIEDASIFMEECWGDLPPELQRVLYASPTGTGKGTIELALLKGLREQGVDAWIFTPSLEVLRGFLERCEAGDLSDVSGEKLAEMGEAIFVTTPVRARNRIRDGERGTAEVVIFDEVHHAIATNDVAGELFAVAPDAVWLGFTATPYRASPRATAILREDWGDPVEVMSIPAAVAEGFMALPTFRVVPLVDDDKVQVANGEFQGKAATKAYKSRIDDLAKLIADEVEQDDLVANEHGIAIATKPAMPTAVTVPSSDVAGMLVEALDVHGVPSIWIHAKTKAEDRAKAYEACKHGEAVLISIKVINEGVDFPWLRRLIDARPTMSPVSWLQTLGRIMRPGDVRPAYICTNRNLERHAYLLQGALPREKFAEAQAVFEKPSKRAGMRQIGLEALKRFKAIPLPLDGGATGAMYCVHSISEETGVKTAYVTLLDPTAEHPFVASRSIQALMPGEKKRGAGHYGKWGRCAMPLDFTGFATSSATGAFSDKQKEWWTRDARKYGLSDRKVDQLTRRQFQALPVLANTKCHMRGGSV